ncbi:kinase-like protein [Backusella circina FSU 941]|nr:kinase-like protein [Backusella circina FSU 941]
MSQSLQRRDWEKDFYKNGYPNEVIVIEDTPPLEVVTRKRNREEEDLLLLSNNDSAIKKHKWKDLPALHPPPSHASLNQKNIFSFHLYPTTATTATVTNHHHGNDNNNNNNNNNSNNNTEPYDDINGHYVIRPNESLTPQYKIMRLLGQGTFGKVVECYDRVRRTYCAIKIIRAIPKYRDASKIEIRVLNALKQHDPLNLNKCIHLVEWFDHKNHICMVFELLGQSVFDFLKANQFKPFPNHQIQQLGKQLLTSVAFLHDLKLVHTDLKPENILLVNNQSYDDNLLESTDIRLIDFGSATFEKDYHSSVVSTRHYRAPEIILSIGWSYPCDIWSVGCILVEFFTGDALFQTHDNLEHLAMMESILGPFPPNMISSASRDVQKWFKNNRLKFPTSKTVQQRKKYVNSLKPLKDIIPPTSSHNIYLLDLLKKMLVYEPSHRISAREALRHPFFHSNV